MPEDKMPLPGGRELFYVQYKITGLGLLRLESDAGCIRESAKSLNMTPTEQTD